MDMTIPSIILFSAMGLGLAMIPSIVRDSITTIKEIFQED